MERWYHRSESNRLRFNWVPNRSVDAIYSQSGISLELSISQKTRLILLDALAFTSELYDCNEKICIVNMCIRELVWQQWFFLFVRHTCLKTIVGTLSSFGTEISLVLISAFNCNRLPSSPSTHLLTAVQSPPASSKHYDENDTRKKKQYVFVLKIALTWSRTKHSIAKRKRDREKGVKRKST